ncbi:MAG: hypothetical protein QMC70_04605 [Bacteroidia bacterium]
MQSLFTTDEFVLKYPCIYGISTSMRHVKLGYGLSVHPDIALQYEEDISDYSKESKHAAYHLTFLDDQSSYLIIKNRGTKHHFYPKYKQVDYLLCSMNEEEINSEIVQIVGKLKGISICFALNNPSPKEILNFTQLQ